MKKFKELVKSPYYWIETIQDELYCQLSDYMKKNKKNQNDVAKDLKVSKSYVSQILNGNFNFTLKKFIELSLYMGKVPSIQFVETKDYIEDYETKLRYVVSTDANRNVVHLKITGGHIKPNWIRDNLNEKQYSQPLKVVYQNLLFSQSTVASN